MGGGEGGVGGGILEGLLESGDEEGDEVLLEGGIELVRQPIRAGPLTAGRLADGGMDALGREARHAVGSLGLTHGRRRETLWRGREEGGLGCGVGGTDGKERGVVVGEGVSSRSTLSRAIS